MIRNYMNGRVLKRRVVGTVFGFAILVCALLAFQTFSSMAGPISVGINFSDGSASSQIAGDTTDGCSNWVDSFTLVNNGFVDKGYSGLACGSATFASGVITCQWNSSDSFEAGNSSSPDQDLYLSYLDDGNNGGCNVNQSGPIGVSVTLSGISKWLAANYATRYQVRLYCSSTWNLSQMITSTPVAVRLGAPNPANGSTQLTALAVLETVQMQWLGDGGFPTTNSGSAARGYGDSSGNLSNDTISITIPWQGALSNQTRGSLAAIKLTPVNAVTAPTGPLLAYEQSVTNNSPLVFWRLNETNGVVAFDYFGNYNGSIGGGVTLGINGPRNPPFSGFGTNNTAMLLSNTANSYLTMPTFNLNTNSVTITGWINPSGIETSLAGVVFCRSGTTAAGVNFTSGSNNELRYTWNGARNNVSTGLVAPTNQWSFFALVVTPSGATLYLGTNGVLNTFTDNVSETNQAFDAPLLLGYDTGGSGRGFTGGIAEVALYRQVLTPAQIQLQYISAAGCLGNPSIVNSPTNLTVYSGTNGTFSASATGPTVLSYQWQVSTNGGATFANISGATNTSYTTQSVFLSNSSNEFRMVANGLCGSPATSAAATLTVLPQPLDGYGLVVTNYAPLAYWRLNETNGSTIAYDYLQVYNGTIEAGVTAGVSGPQNPPFPGFTANNTAMSLNGTPNSYLSMPAFYLNTNTVTITGWINPSILEPSSAGVVFDRGDHAGGVNFSGAVNNELQYTWESRYDISTGLIVPTNQWSFFALVVTANGATLYLGTNGVLNSFTDVYPEQNATFDAPLLLGFDSSNGSRLYSGKIAAVALYKYSLTPSQIQLLYIAAAGCPGIPTITTNPVSQSVTSGSSASFSVGATGPTPITYQWQSSTNAGASYFNLTGASNTVYSTALTTLSNSGTVYRALATGLCGAAATSSVAVLSVVPPPPLAPYAQAMTNNNALAYWRMNEPAGSTVAYDFFGVYNGAIGQYVNAGVPGPQSPQFSGFETNNTAMQCNGYSGSALTMPTFNLNTNTVTITGWINPTGNQIDYTGIVFCRGGSTIAGVNFNDAASSGYNELRYTWNGVRYDVPTGLRVPTNQWSFFALVVNPTGATLYLGTNGVLNSFSDTFTEPAQVFGASLLIGYDSVNNRQYNGRIDEVALFNQALTTAQIEQFYITAAGCPGSPVITTNPANQSVLQGSTATFTAAATAPTLFSYQWQISTNGGATFSNLSGATNSTYTTPVTTLANSGSVYQVFVTGLCGSPATSSTATLSVNLPPPLGAYAVAISNSQALAYWRLNETNGVTAYDFFGNYNGTIGSGVVLGILGPQNPPIVGFEALNPAMRLTTSNNSYLTMPSFNLNTNTVTITGWLNPTGVQADNAGLVFCRGATTIVGLNFGMSSNSGVTNELQYTWGTRSGISTGLLVPTNQWSFFALVIAPNGAIIYLGTNGVLRSSTDVTILPNEAFDAPLLLGYDVVSGSRLFKGGIDEVALYNRSLSQAQIEQFYIAGAGCPGSPTITTNPANQTLTAGAQATFNVAATGPTLLFYQWQISTNGGSSFAGISGATNSTYITPALTLTNSGNQYMALVSGLCGVTATSTVATVTVNPPPPLAPYAQAVSNALALAYWRLNETNGTTAFDFFGVNNGVIEPGVTIGVAGPRNPPFTGFETNNNAMLLNGGSLSFLSMPQFNISNNVVSITGWINPSGPQADYAGVVFCRNGSAPVGLNFGPGSTSGLTNELQYTWGDRYGVSTHLLVPTNQWSFFALVVSANGATIYLETNGVMNSSTDTTPEPVEVFGAPLVIGSDSSSSLRYFKGSIDEVALFTNALTAAQFEQMYIAGGGCPGNPSISTQPNNQTVVAGSTASFTIAATGPTLLTIQWQVSTNGGVSFANITSATNAIYTTGALSTTASGSVYRAVVTGLCGTPATSSSATLIVDAAAILASYPTTVTNNSPLAYWRLNETNGATVAMDFFGVNNGTINSGVVPGVPGPQNPPFAGFETNNTAMLLNGGSLSYLTMPQFNLNTNTVTITGWINPSVKEADWTGVTFWRGGSTVAGLNFGPGSSTGITNELQYTWGNRFGISTHLTVPTNQWSFFALVVTPNGATLYLETNGVLNSSTDTTPEPSLAFDSPLYLGYDISSTARLFKGSLDEIALYTHALTPAQIQQFYVAGAGCSADPSVTNQPVSQAVTAGATAMFNVGATGPTLLTYQWQSSTNGGATFANINGATNTSYTTPATTLANNGTEYQAVITGLCGSPTTSAAATLTVNPPPSLSAFPMAISNSLPIAYWRLNEPYGATVALDFFGVNNGTINSGVTPGVPGPQNPPFVGFETNNTAMLLNATANSYLTMPTFNFNTNTVTILGWINPTGAQADLAGVVYCRGGTTAAGVNFGPGSTSGVTNELQYTWGNRFGISTHLIVPTNQWSFFALVVTPAGATVYVGTNGVLNAFTDAFSQSSEAFDAPLLLGYDTASGSRKFNGNIDEIAIYNRALTTQQLQQFCIAGAGCPGNPVIVAPPVSQAVFSGSPAMFTVSASGPTLLTYQWQISTNGGASFTNLGGATNTTYTTPSTTPANNGQQYQVVVTGLCGSPTTSAAATLSVEYSLYAQTAITNTPVAYWRLNETNGASVALDVIAGNNGTINSGVTGGVPGPSSPQFAGFETNNTAMSLNGTANSYLTMPQFNLNTNTVTITGWINPSGIQADWAAIVFCRSAATSAGLNFNNATSSGTNQLRYTWNSARYDTPTGLYVPINQWSFFALVVTPNGATLYLGANGQLNSYTDALPLPIQAFDAPLLLGRDSLYGRPFVGGIDEVALYNSALTPAQIQQFYISGTGCGSGPSVTSQPTNQTVLVGSTATFSVTATGGITPSYQWQISTNAGATFANINAATNTSYTTPVTTLANNGALYQVVVSGLCGAPVTSAAATLYVNPLTPPLPAYSQAVTNDGAIAYWRLNETNGASIAYDFFGVYNGVIGSSVTPGVPGPQSPQFPGFETNNTAMLFNGTTNSVLTTPAFYSSNNTLTITGWINPSGTQTDSAGVVFCRGGTTVAGLNFGPGSTSAITNELRYTWNNTRSTISTGLIVPTNQWSFFALVVTPAGATIYLGTNGTLSSYVDSVSLPTQAFATPLYIGSDGLAGHSFKGVLDEVGIYERSLTPAQIQQLYFNGAGCPGGPSVTGQPTNQTVLIGSTVTFSVTATGPTPLSYQWQVSTNGGASFANLTGATNTSYTTPPTSTGNNGNQYQVVITGLCDAPMTSAVAILSISVPPPPLNSNYGQTVTNFGPYAYWRMNETNGASVAYDYFGIYNGSIGSGVIAGVPGQQNPPFTGFETNKTAMQLNGTGGSYLTMPALNLNTNSVTITGWINPTGAQADWAGVVFCRSGTTVAGLNFGQGSVSGMTNELRYTWNNDRYYVSTGLIVPSNQWSFIALSVTSTGATVYLGNGAVLSSVADASALPGQPFDNSLVIGLDSASGNRMFQGLVNEVAIYKQSLTASQIQQLYTAATTGFTPPALTPFQQWQFQYFGCTNCPRAAAGFDADGDGFSNWQKFLAGINPTNPATSFRIISASKLGSDVQVTWMTGLNKTNALQKTPGAANGGFNTNLFADIFVVTNTTGSATNYLDRGAATNAPASYYRVRLVP